MHCCSAPEVAALQRCGCSMQFLSHASQARPLHTYMISRQGNARVWLHVCIHSIESMRTAWPLIGERHAGAP